MCLLKFGSSPLNSRGSAARIFSSSSPRSRFSRAVILGFAPGFFFTTVFVGGGFLSEAGLADARVDSTVFSGVGGRRAAAAAASAARMASRAARAASSTRRIALRKVVWGSKTQPTCLHVSAPARTTRLWGPATCLNSCQTTSSSNGWDIPAPSQSSTRACS